MEAHFPRKALATHEASSPQVVLLAVLNYHRLSQKCIGSGKFNRLSITLSARDYCRTCFDKSMVCVLTTKRLCSDFTSVVLIGTLPGALNRLTGSSAELDSLENN